MLSVDVRIGDIFKSKADVLVLPCSTAGKVTSAIQRGIDKHSLPRLEGSLRPGEVRAMTIPRGRWKLLCYAAPVATNSNGVIINRIGFDLGCRTDFGNFLSIAVPLLGTGPGLNSTDAAKALVEGFRGAASPDARLIIYVRDEGTYERVLEVVRAWLPIGSLQRKSEAVQEPEGSATKQTPVRPTAPPRDRAGVFISYSHKDRKWLERLQVHLRPLERDHSLAIWDDTKIKPGTDWRGEIRRAIETAKVAILLISADFLASEFIDKNELPPLLRAAKEDGALILPVIVSPSRFVRTENLNGFQSVNDPEKPLNSLKGANRERILTQVVDAVESALLKP